MQPRFGKAIVVAPLAAPVAIFSMLLLREAFGSVHEGSIAAIPVWLFALVLFGAPPAYLSTLVILWPVSRALASAERFTWPVATAISAFAGAIIMPAYLRALEPRGRIDLFPGAGVLAGAATGLAFWVIATRPRTETTFT